MVDLPKLTPDAEDVQAAVRKTYEFLGVEREAFVCPDCQVACEPTRVHDPRRAAFDGGESPAWECPDCSKKYVREVSDASHTLDLYGRE
jgi:rubredoxin